MHSLKRIKLHNIKSFSIAIKLMLLNNYDVFCVHLRSSSRGLHPVRNSIVDSNDDQNLIEIFILILCKTWDFKSTHLIFSSGQFSQPVVIQ